MLPFAKLLVMFDLLLLAPVATAQNNLGALLDAGAAKLSPDEFKRELVQHAIVGPTPTGSMLEVIYTVNGMVEGAGTATLGASTPVTRTRISGEWRIDGNARICTSMKFSSESGGWGTTGGVGVGLGYLPPRCQFWFKLGDTYFLSDSDSDRSALITIRTTK